MNKALICVDVQPDFLPGGPLGVPDGNRVIPELINMMNDVDVIVLTRDWHPEDHISFSDNPKFVDGSWPRHCINSTDGAAFHPDIRSAALNTGKPVVLIHKGFKQDKEAYSGFDGRVVAIVNDTRRDNFHDLTLRDTLVSFSITDVSIGGLALDYCVKATAIDSMRAGFPTSVFLNATRPVTFVTGCGALFELIQNNVAIRGF
jgi:nicotinamidase/pyrazinamidase